MFERISHRIPSTRFIDNRKTWWGRFIASTLITWLRFFIGYAILVFLSRKAPKVMFVVAWVCAVALTIGLALALAILIEWAAVTIYRIVKGNKPKVEVVR